MEKIDNLDRQILEIISQNARIPFKDVAAECGVSRAAIHQRVQRLIDLGVIVGSGYHVNPKSLGYRTCTYVGIKLEKGSMYKAVVTEMQKIPEIVECHFTTGPYTMLTKVYARIRTSMSYEDWYFYADFDFSKGKFSQKNIFLQYSLEGVKGTHRFKAGYRVPPGRCRNRRHSLPAVCPESLCRTCLQAVYHLHWVIWL